MFLNDDDAESAQDNWKNSEVMRIFAELHFPVHVETASEVIPAVVETPQVLSELPKEDIVALRRQTLVASLDEAMQKIARLSSEYGNEKVKYMLERAKAELEKIIQTGESDVF